MDRIQDPLCLITACKDAVSRLEVGLGLELGFGLELGLGKVVGIRSGVRQPFEHAADIH